MAIHDKFLNPAADPSTVSRNIKPGEKSYDQVVFQSGKPVLDAELNFDQALAEYTRTVLLDNTHPSGWVLGDHHKDPYSDYTYYTGAADGAFVPNAFRLKGLRAVVAGLPIMLEYHGNATADNNLITLDVPTIYDGTAGTQKRHDFVWLEVWRALVSPSVRSRGTITISTGTNIAVGESIDFIIPVDMGGTGGVQTVTAIAVVAVASDFTNAGTDVQIATSLVAAINATVTGVMADNLGGTSAVVTVKCAMPGAGGDVSSFDFNGPDGLTPIALTTFTGGVDKPNKPLWNDAATARLQDKVYRHGCVTSTEAVWLQDELTDSVIDAESTKRVQVQWRIDRTGMSGTINFKTQPDGFSNAGMLGRGSGVGGVATYPFVPADGTTVSANSSAVAYGKVDPGLWISGDGTAAAALALGTVDGFVYAIPICMVHRHNDAGTAGAGGGTGFDPVNNANGALLSTHINAFNNVHIGYTVPTSDSDRPDGELADWITGNQILDLRRHVMPTGASLQAEAAHQMQCLLDGTLQTWSVDGADVGTLGNGSGHVSRQYLVCNEIGRETADGGDGITSGDTNRGQTIRNFDHIARRFGAQAVVERVVLALYPSEVTVADGIYVVHDAAQTTWHDGDEIHIDLGNLPATSNKTWRPVTETVPGKDVNDLWPTGTKVTDVLMVWHDDGNSGGAVDQNVQIDKNLGIGTNHVVISLGFNNTLVDSGRTDVGDHNVVATGGANDGSARRIFIELEVTYPCGYGLTDTPDLTLSPDGGLGVNPWPYGPMIENSGPILGGGTQRPIDMELPLDPAYRTGMREVMLEYEVNSDVAATPITENVVSTTVNNLFLSHRLYGVRSTVTVTETETATARAVDDNVTEFGSSSRKLVTLDLLTQEQTQCDVNFYAQDAIPNYGAGGGYQVSVYYKTTAPQTAGVQGGVMTPTLPNVLELEPLAMAKQLWCGTQGAGSDSLPYPYTNPLDQIAINPGTMVPPPFDWYFNCTAEVAVHDFDINSGLITLHPNMQGDASANITLGDGITAPVRDQEFRAYYSGVATSTYRPTVMAQLLYGAARHKAFFPFLARVAANPATGTLWRKGEVVLVVMSRMGELDGDNVIQFTDTDNRSALAVYRTRGMVLTVGKE